MKYLVGIPCLYGAGHTKKAIESVAGKANVDIVLIDNGAEPAVKSLLGVYECRDNVTVIRNEENIFVNPAWNQIIKHFIDHPEYDYLLIMNSDLILQKDWNLLLDLYFENYPDIIPLPVILNDSTVHGMNINLTLQHEQVFEGTPGVLIILNKKHVKIVYPIPSYIKVWFGDNWIFDILRVVGYQTVIAKNLLSYHAWSQNVSKVEGIHDIIENDKSEWEIKGIKDAERVADEILNKKNK